MVGKHRVEKESTSRFPHEGSRDAAHAEPSYWA